MYQILKFFMNIAKYLFILILTISCQDHEIKFLTFKDCKIDYMVYNKDGKEMHDDFYSYKMYNQSMFESARRRLALCLCNKYLQNPDEETKNKILEIYHAKEEYLLKKHPENLDFDTIIKNRIEIFQFNEINKEKAGFKARNRDK